MMKKIILPVLFFLFLIKNIYPQPVPPSEIGVVLAGGGALGLAHIGVLQVLEELEVPVDRIGGTSMGGLVGALYAIGYTPDQMEKIATQMDWSVMMGNAFDRKKAPYWARSEQERFIFSAERKGTQVSLGYALIDGMNIYHKFQELCAPAMHVRDFEQLPVPFFCVAADLEFEDQVVFRRGYLPDALRATMSIPLVFNPVKMEGMLLVDGGLLNNFPVREMRQKGADLVIGVQLVEYDSTATQTGLFDLIGKTYEIVMEKVRCEYEDECDVCIEVQLPGYNAGDFDKAAELIQLGREAAEKMADELKKYRRPGFKKRKKLVVSDELLTLGHISINGQKFIREEKIRKILDLPLNVPVRFSDVREAMENLQATNLFQSMRYRIDKEEKENILKLFVEEKNNDFFKIGLRYDNDFGASLLLNATFRHTFAGGDFATVEIRLNRNPYFQARYIYRSLREYTPFFVATIKGDDYFNFKNENNFDLFQHNQIELKGGLQWTPYNSMQIKTGLEWQWYGFNENSDQNILKPLNKHLLNYFLEISIDRLNKTYYPTQGFKSFVSSKFITPSVYDFKNADKNIWLSAGFYKMFPFSEKTTGRLSADVGISTGYIGRQFLFYQGGLYDHLRPNVIVQPGLPLMRYSGKNAAAIGYNLRFNIYKGHHIWAGYQTSALGSTPAKWLETKWRQGVYIGYGLQTIIGPLKIQLGIPLEDFNTDVLISAGHRF